MSRFVIDEREYDIPTLETFDLDEAMILYENTGLGLEDLFYDKDAEDAEDVAARFRHPGVIKTLVHVAFRRGNPGMNAKRVADLVGKANYTDVFVQLLEGALGGDAEDPPPEDTTKKPPGSSPESSSSKPNSTLSEHESSGNGSLTSSEAPAEDQQTIATPESPTSPGTREPLRAA